MLNTKLSFNSCKFIFSGLRFCAVAVFFSLACFGQKTIKDLKPTVILISLDGFRSDYLEKYQPPTLNEMARKGVRAKWMIPSFPTKTFPNHYTIATGLYPAHHGLVENNVYYFDAIFGIDKKLEARNPRWWLGEPIWVTAEKQGKHSAAYFFPGTETAIAGVRPTFFKEYNGKSPNDLRVDTVLSWLDLPIEKRPTMLTLYFSDVDDAGHEFSPDAEETRYAVLEVDDNLKRLANGLKQRKIFEQINIIVVSDHGMATVDRRNAVFLDDFFDDKQAEQILWTGEIVQIFPKAGEEDRIITALRGKVKHATCWKKSEIPARFNYNDSPRIASIVCSADEGWVLTNRKRYDEWRERDELRGLRGAHGYDNQLKSMRAIFVAHGAAFKKSYVTGAFENIHVYNLMCRILNLTPAKNDGNFDLAKAVLK